MKVFILFIISVTLLLSSELSIISKKKDENSWKIHYEIKPKQDVNRTLLTYNGEDINSTIIESPNKNLSTAIMFLIDTSAPLKKDFNNGMKLSIVDMFSLKNPWDRWAISGFSDTMQIFGDYNQTEPNKALDQIVVRGQRTELFRASLEAIKSLSTQDSKRKFLFIFSDGEAEDNAYTYQEVINKAKEAKVTIIGFGYRDTIYLQSLRRMSEKTGGKLYIADKYNYKLPTDYIDDLNATLNNDFEISFNSNILQENAQGKVEVKLKLYFDNNTSASKNIALKVKKLVPVKVKKKNYIPYYIIAGIVVLIILFLILRPKKEEFEEEIEKDVVAPEPIAYFQSSSGAKQYIYKNHNSIGALAENDIVIEGEYISRHHAILDLKDGEFHLTDNNSANKVFVNYKEVSSSIVKDEDIVAFGPYEVTFRVIEA